MGYAWTKKNKIKSCLSEDIKRKDNKKFTGKDLHDFEKIYRRRIVHKHAKNGWKDDYGAETWKSGSGKQNGWKHMCGSGQPEQQSSSGGGDLERKD